MKPETFGRITLYNADCMDVMREMPDNAFDLAIVDPPYGIGRNWTKDPHSRFYKHRSSYNNDKTLDEEYFKELFRVSKNQIIWGGNYFTKHLPPRNSWIVWDKKKDFPTQHASEGELAWTSYNIPLRIVELIWSGACVCEPRYGVHPHEKPQKLYRWLLTNYLQKHTFYRMKILDTHLGSGSICIACDDLGFEMTGIELDPDYYEAARKRLIDHQAQQKLF